MCADFRTGLEVLTEPTVEYCPRVEKKISGYGFCCQNRAFGAEPIVAHGASEMMQVWLEKDLIDCAVVVCEGAGAVITSNGKLVQAISAR
jgi:hypothetical protein